MMSLTWKVRQTKTTRCSLQNCPVPLAGSDPPSRGPWLRFASAGLHAALRSAAGPGPVGKAPAALSAPPVSGAAATWGGTDGTHHQVATSARIIKV